jgi:hypothetical protein
MCADYDAESAAASPVETDAARAAAGSRGVLIATCALAGAVFVAVLLFGLPGGDSRSGDGRGAPDGSVHWRHGGPAGADDGCPFDAAHPPRLVFDLPPEGVAFGAVKQDVVMHRDVVFRNEGSGPLCVRRVGSGCGCIKATLLGEKRRFEPGEEGTVRVILDTTGREGQEEMPITFYTNAHEEPNRRFLVRASVTLGMRISPSFVNFGGATQGHPAEAIVRLRTPKDDAAWEVTSVEGPALLEGAVVPYTWQVVDVPDPADLVREIVIHHPGVHTQDVRVFDDEVVVRTTHPDRPEYRVPARLVIVDPILPVPTRAVLGNVPSASPTVRIRLVPGDDGVEFQVTGLAFEAPSGVERRHGGLGFVATHGRDEGGGWYVEVRYDGKSRRPGALRATLVVSTDLDRMPQVRIPCTAAVVAPRPGR